MNCNESFFDVIDTEDKAYWLGFIAADGSVTIKHPKYNGKEYYYPYVCIALKDTDKEHLVKFLHSLNSNAKLYLNKRKNRNYTEASVNISSKQLVDSLNKLGIYPNKTKTIKPCSCVPINLERHYWRGIFDGDGCIHTDKKRKYVPSIKLVLNGTKEICQGFLDFILFNKIQTKAKVTNGHGCYQMQLGGNILGTKILNLLYSNNTISLDRKDKLYNTLTSNKRGSFPFTHLHTP